jgi:hypothetical protein
MLSKISFFIILGTILSFGCQGSWEKRSSLSNNENIEDVVGVYSFEFPTGEIEVLQLNSDSSYSQTIYKDEGDYLNHSPLFSNNGRFLIMEGNELHFENWLAYCLAGDPDIILSKPNNVYLMDVFFYSKKGKRPCCIVISDQFLFIFRKVDNVPR